MNHKNPNSLYPQVIQTNPEAPNPISPSSSSSSSSSSLYPTLDMNDLGKNLFPEEEEIPKNPNYNPQSIPIEEILIEIPSTIVHLIDKQRSIELASGEFNVVRIRQGENVVAVLARVGDQIQWPLAKDEASVKLDETHYFFTLRVPGEGESEEMLNYGLTVVWRGNEGLLREFDGVLESYSSFSRQRVEGVLEVLEGASAEERSAAYWTTLAPNVEDYSGCVARLIAGGSVQLIKGILWCGDVTVDRLKWGNEFLKKRMGPLSESEISPETLRRIQRVKKLTKMSEQVATGVLSGVVKVSGFFTSSIVNSKVGKKFFSLMPGEIVLASLDGFNKVCDAVEVAGRNVMSTTSVVTTGLVSQRYGEKAAKATNEGFGAAGHAFGTAWAVFKIRKALNPKSVVKPTTLAKAVAETKSSELKAKNAK